MHIHTNTFWFAFRENSRYPREVAPGKIAEQPYGHEVRWDFPFNSAPLESIALSKIIKIYLKIVVKAKIQT